MKKILIVNKSFQLGGIQSALRNMLNVLAEEDVKVDLMIFNDRNKEKENLPKNVRLISPCIPVKTMGMSLKDAIHTKNPIIIVLKTVFAIWSKIFGNTIPIAVALMFQKKLCGYDYALAYHHETKTNTTVSGFVRFILKKCDAKEKIGWIHTDFKAAGLNTEKNRKLYAKLDRIICVSKAVMKSFTDCYPELSLKCDYCYNCISTEEIKEKSNKKPDFHLQKENGRVCFFSACRLSAEKGIERTIGAMMPLIKEGYSFKWYIAGDGILFNKISKKIKQNKLEDIIILMDYQENPYPYMTKCDWFLLPSFHEAFPMVAIEALTLGTPVFATEMPAMRELIDENNGYICDNTTEGIEKGLRHILMDNAVLPKNVGLKKEMKNSSLKLKQIFKTRINV